MSSKAIFFFCAQAFLVQSVFSQCAGRLGIDGYGANGYLGAGWQGSLGGYDGYASQAMAYDAGNFAGRNFGYDGMYSPMSSMLDFTPTSGGGLQVTSASAIPPTGISVVSENAYEGALTVAGELPFVGTTDMEGVVPSAGAGAINHACGNGATVMASDSTGFAPGYAGSIAGAGIAPAAAIAPAASYGAGYGAATRFGYGGCAGRGLMY